MNIRKIRKQIHFHSSQRWAVTIIIALITSIIIYGRISTSQRVNSKYNRVEHIEILENLKSKRDYENNDNYKTLSKPKLNPKQFDPNTITKEELVSMGIKQKDAKSWVKYTSKGGRFYKTKDLKKLYSMTDEIYSQLEPFVHIPNTKTHRNSKGKNKEFENFKEKSLYSKKYHKKELRNNSIKDSIQNVKNQDEIAYQKNFKSRRNEIKSGIKKDFIISINETDSTELQILKGIGPVLSSRIIKYRDQLGGFHNMNQLLEVYGVKPVLLGTIIDRISFVGQLKKIKLNHIELQELVEHPYFDYQTAQIFINYRKQHGDYNSIDDVKKIRIIKSYWLEETAPYLDFQASSN